MENAIDQLFRKKLDDHQVAPSADAWSKVEAQLSKKNKPAIAWRIAAAILLTGFFVLTIYWLSRPVEIDQPLVVDKKVNEPIQQSKEDKKINSEKEKEVAQSNVMAFTQKKLIKSTTPIVVEVKKEILTEQPSQEQTHLNNETVTVTPEVTVAEEKPLVIEFVLEDVPLQPVIAEVAPESEKGIKKVYETVKEFKNGERPLGLRQAKNDLLAFHHKKDDSKNN
jgi:hypothetical protein